MGAFTNLLSTFRKNRNDLTAQLREIRAELDAARRKHEELATEPLPVEDVVTRIKEFVDERAVRCTNLIEEKFQIFRNPSKQATNSVHERLSGLLSTGQHGNESFQALETMLCFLLRDEMKAGLERAIRSMQHPKTPSMAERAAEMQKLGAKITELEAVERELVEAFESLRSEIVGAPKESAPVAVPLRDPADVWPDVQPPNLSVQEPYARTRQR